MNSASVKIPYAEKDGRLIHVSRVESGLQCGCVCPVCKRPVLARKGSVVRHHFAHYGGGECSPETVLHQVGKRLLKARISRHLERGRPLQLRWKCRFCPETHEGDLLKLARRVDVEKVLDGCRPDLVLSDGGGNPLAVLEIVVTHSPEENVREYCRKHDVAMVCFRVRNGRDLLALDVENPLRPSRVGLCLNPQCEICGKALSPATMHVVAIPCWRCGFEMKAAMVKADGRMAGPEVFSSGQTKIAEEAGVYISRRHSRTSNRRYLANTCPSCGAFTGAPYLHLYSPMIRNGKGMEAGGVCVNCMKISKPHPQSSEKKSDAT